MVRLLMPTGVLRKLESRERGWQSLASLAERRRSSVIQTILVAYNARSLGGYASSRMRKSLIPLKVVSRQCLLTFDKSVLEVAKVHPIPLLQIQKISSHDRCHHELILNHSRLSSARAANLFPLDRHCAEHHPTRRLTTRSASELATLTSLRLHQRHLLDFLLERQALPLTLGWKFWSLAPSTTTSFEIGR